MLELGKVESLTGEEEHETNEMERESLGNGREGMEATEGSVRCHEPSSLLDGRWTASISVLPLSYLHAKDGWPCSRRTWGAMRRKLEPTDRPPCSLLECGNYSCNRRSTSAPFHAHCTQVSAPHPFRFQLKVFPASCLTHPSFRFVIGDIKSDIPLPRVSSTRHASDAPLASLPHSPPRSEPRIERGGAWLPRCLPYLSTDERATRTTPPTRRPTDRPTVDPFPLPNI